MTDPISPDLKTAMRRLRLGKLLDTLPERLALARQQKMAHQDFLLLLLSDECQRRDSAASTTRAERALLEPDMQLERWDPTAKVTYDQELLNELVSMRFVEAHRHVTIVGPVGVGKTFIAHALGHIACRHKYSVLAVRTDKLLKTLKHARLDHSHEAELRKLLAVDVLIVDGVARQKLRLEQEPAATACCWLANQPGPAPPEGGAGQFFLSLARGWLLDALGRLRRLSSLRSTTCSCRGAKLPSTLEPAWTWHPVTLGRGGCIATSPAPRARRPHGVRSREVSGRQPEGAWA